MGVWSFFWNAQRTRESFAAFYADPKLPTPAEIAYADLKYKSCGARALDESITDHLPTIMHKSTSETRKKKKKTTHVEKKQSLQTHWFLYWVKYAPRLLNGRIPTMLKDNSLS